MTYKLLAVDLDGTLVRRDGAVHEVDRRAIGRLQAAGVPVTIATGRLYSGTRHVAWAANIVGPVACVDGSHIVDTRDHRALYSRALLGDHAASLQRVVENSGAASFLFAQDKIVHDARGDAFAPYVRTWSTDITVVDSVTSHPYWEHEEGVHAVVAVGTESQIKGATEVLSEAMGTAAFVMSFPVLRLAGMFAMIVRASGVSKGTAIEWLAEHYGILPSEVVAVGDWLNDVPMFKVAGRSFVMAQAPDIVKGAATDHLEMYSSQGGGVAEAIQKVWGAV